MLSQNDWRLIKDYILLENDPIINAAKDGDLARVKNLLVLNISTKTKDEYERKALSWVAKKGHVEVVRLLLETKAAVDEESWFGLTLLSYAAESGHNGSIQRLLSKISER